MLIGTLYVCTPIFLVLLAYKSSLFLSSISSSLKASLPTYLQKLYLNRAPINSRPNIIAVC